jgi:hypothetical protein
VVTALVAGLVTTVVWMVTGLESHITARAVTFVVAMGAAVLVSLFSEPDARSEPVAPGAPKGQTEKV